MELKSHFKLEKMDKSRKPVTIIDVVADLLPEHLSSKSEWSNREIEKFMEDYGDEIYSEFVKRRERSPLNINRERLFALVNPCFKELYSIDDETLEKIKEYLIIYEIGIYAENFPARVQSLQRFYDSESETYIVERSKESDYYELIHSLLCLNSDEMQELDSFIKIITSEDSVMRV